MARAPFEFDEMRGVPDEAVGHVCDGFERCHIGFEGARRRADAALHAVREDFGEVVGRSVRIAQPFFVAPIRKVNVLLHARPMKGSIGESIECRDVKVVIGEKAPHLLQRVRLTRLFKRNAGELQAYGERLIRRDVPAHCEHVVLQHAPDFVPGLAAMDVCTIG